MMKYIQAKKSLGQNFLKSKKALLAMIQAGSVGENDIVVEIGPGKGALTRELLEVGATVIAFEKDHRLIELLTTTFAPYIEAKKFMLYEEDILNVDVSNHPAFDTMSHGFKKDYKLIANIPYYITGEITRRFLTIDHKPTCIVILVQKEVADRIADTKETILSLSVKVFGTPKKIMTVKKEYFSPVPKVDSAIIKISNISNPFKTKEDELKFFTILKKAFGQKRKKINTTLKEYKDTILNWNEIKEKRPEDLNVEEWKKVVGI